MQIYSRLLSKTHANVLSTSCPLSQEAERKSEESSVTRKGNNHDEEIENKHRKFCPFLIRNLKSDIYMEKVIRFKNY